MKTLVTKIAGESKYIWPDDAVVTIGSDMTAAPQFFIADMNESNAMIVENVTPPEDWKGCKYLLSNGVWSLNPNWGDPNNPPPIPDKP